MTNLNRDDPAMRDVLATAQVIAVVGHSDDPQRTSYQIAAYLRRVGYVVYPVNPMIKEVDGQKSYASLADVPEAINIVNVFRRSEYLAGVVEESIAVRAKAIWSQLGVIDEAAAQRALEAGLSMAMDRCIKVEHQRLLGG